MLRIAGFPASLPGSMIALGRTVESRRTAPDDQPFNLMMMKQDRRGLRCGVRMMPPW
jgi:hypothetical protein